MAVTTTRTTEQLRDRVEILGWRYESYSEYSEHWTPVITLDEHKTPAVLRERDGEIRNVTPLVRLDEVVAAVEDVGVGVGDTDE